MQFDYTIVLAFALAGWLFAIARRRARGALDAGQIGAGSGEARGAQVDSRHFTVVLIAVAFTAGLALLFPWALVLRDCLHDRGAAQSRGIGALALLEGAVFLAMLIFGVVYVWKKADLESIGELHGADTQDTPTGREP